MKKDDEEKEEKVSKAKLFFEAYKQSSAFKASIKLCIYFLVCFLIIIVVAMSRGEEKGSSYEDEKSTTTVVASKNYHDILNDLKNKNKTLTYEVTKGEVTYYISYSYKDSISTGLFETANEPIKKFIIKDNLVYEVVLHEEKENNELFKELKIDYININNLVDLLVSNKGLKMLEDNKTIYKYEIDGVDISVSVVEDIINNIQILDNDTTYKIDIKVGE